jgi:hypothetical protein
MKERISNADMAAIKSFFGEGSYLKNLGGGFYEILPGVVYSKGAIEEFLESTKPFGKDRP